jgi:excisionase family DNA binding protein
MDADEHERSFLTIPETAAELRVSPATVRRRIKAGELPAYQPGGPGSAVRIERSVLDDLQRESPRSVSTYSVSTRHGREDLIELVGRTYGADWRASLVEHFRRSDLLAETARVVDDFAEGTGLDEELDYREQVEVEAHELARRHRHAERVRERALEILEQEQEQEGD